MSPEALNGIATYKYKSGTYTWLDNQMTPFWNFCVLLLPKWMAPNLVTLIGTLVILSSTCILCFYCPNLTEEAPRWTYVVCGVSVFVYQTMDAIDGKQARRTGSSSPLGQLFDHGCDALCTVFNIISAAAAVGCGSTMVSLVMVGAVGTTFYLAQWEEYYTGTLSCGNGVFGVTEGQWVLVVIHLLTAGFGHELWRYKPVDALPYSMDIYLVCILVLSNVVLGLSNVCAVIMAKPLPEEEVGHKQLGKWIAMQHLVPPIVLWNSWCGWINGSAASVYANNPVLCLLTLGIQLVYVATRMIVSHMCKVPFPFQLRILVPTVAIIGMCSPEVFVGPGTEAILDAKLGVYALATITFTSYLYYVISVVSEICKHLNINALTLSREQREKKQ